MTPLLFLAAVSVQAVETQLDRADALLAELTARVDGRGRRVAPRVWDPIKVEVGDVDRVIFVSDGGLASIPFGALPVDGGYLIERYRVSVLESSADLLRWGEDPESYGEPLLVGDVATRGLGGFRGCGRLAIEIRGHWGYSVAVDLIGVAPLAELSEPRRGPKRHIADVHRLPRAG